MHSLSIFGTSSDAGKSTLAFAITYLLHHRGIKVAPFKAQNVSNNSQVCDNGGEIAQPQYFAAEAIALKTSTDMNPVLLKSGGKSKTHLIVNGKSVANKSVLEYYADIKKLQPEVKSAFLRLKNSYECIVAEGAGSPVELNLMDKDLSNIYIAKTFNTKIILVADIERGGVFASVYGVYKLLPKELRKNVIGVIINKFRGDIRLFNEGIKIIQERFNITVLGVVPFKPLNLGFEDAQSMMNYTQNNSKAIIRVGVIKLPHISNFTDFEPLIADREITLSFITTLAEAKMCDMLIIPGSKRVIDDLLWLKKRNFKKIFLDKKITIVGICGGYEMLFKKILDFKNIESLHVSIKGFGVFKGKVVFKKRKIVKKDTYKIFNSKISGYEIHNGITKKIALKRKNVYGTFVHGLFDSDKFRKKIFSKINPEYRGYNFNRYKAKSISDFATHIDEHVDIDKILKEL
jgi:adenosylcobyric acid synthase